MINVDYSRDEDFTEQALKLLRDYYMLPDEQSPQDSFARAALAYSGGDYDFAQRIYEYASKRWFMFASPVLSNAPKTGQSAKVYLSVVFLLILTTIWTPLYLTILRLHGYL